MCFRTSINLLEPWESANTVILDLLSIFVGASRLGFLPMETQWISAYLTLTDVATANDMHIYIIIYYSSLCAFYIHMIHMSLYKLVFFIYREMYVYIYIYIHNHHLFLICFIHHLAGCLKVVNVAHRGVAVTRSPGQKVPEKNALCSWWFFQETSGKSHGSASRLEMIKQ